MTSQVLRLQTTPAQCFDSEGLVNSDSRGFEIKHLLLLSVGDYSIGAYDGTFRNSSRICLQ
jgi:hypothetical protein